MSQQPFTPAALRGAVDLSALKRPPASATGAQPGGSAGAGDLLVTGTDATFQDVANNSVRVPAVVVLWSSRLAESSAFVDVLVDVARANAGRFQVVSVDVDANPGLMRAFQVQSVPTAMGLLQGQVVPLFVGAMPRNQLQPVIDELLKLAVQYGVTGRVSVADAEAELPEPVEEPLPPLLQHALEAIERGDLDAASAAYEQALVEQPGDEEATLGLAQVRLLQRTQHVDAAQARAAAAADPADVSAALLVADLDVLGGHVEDAFARLVDLVRASSGEDREAVRKHLLELFDIVGPSDERVQKGRRALMSALF